MDDGRSPSSYKALPGSVGIKRAVSSTYLVSECERCSKRTHRLVAASQSLWTSFGGSLAGPCVAAIHSMTAKRASVQPSSRNPKSLKVEVYLNLYCMASRAPYKNEMR